MNLSLKIIPFAMIVALFSCAGTETRTASPLTAHKRPPISSTGCYQHTDHDTADLCAQWRAALAAEASAHEARRATNWSVFGAIISLLGTVGLIVTIFLTKKSIDMTRLANQMTEAANTAADIRARETAIETARALAASEQAAAAALEQAQIARETAKIQLRPYLHVRRLAISNFEQFPMNIPFIAINYGETPAHDAKLFTNMQIVHMDTWDGTVTEPKPSMWNSSAPVAKGEKYISYDRPFDKLPTNQLELQRNILNSIRSGETALVLNGRIEYKDDFGNQYHSNYKVILGGPNPPHLQNIDGEDLYPMAYLPDGNEAI